MNRRFPRRSLFVISSFVSGGAERQLVMLAGRLAARGWSVDVMGLEKAGPLIDKPEQAPAELQRIGWETWAGMAMSNLVAFFIMLTTAVALHQHGHTDIESSEQAAAALKPIAGNAAFFLFSLGIIGTGLLAVPVLEQDGSVADRAGHRTRRVLARGDRDDAGPADQADRGLDRDQAVLGGRAQQRARRLGADRRGAQAGGDRDGRA